MSDEAAQAEKKSATIYHLAKFDNTPNGLNEPPPNAVVANAFEPEDEYLQMYMGATRDQGIIQPPYDLRVLDRLSQENNALSPCIEAMVTNIDGTGFDIVRPGVELPDGEDDSNIEDIKAFFSEVYPGMSFRTVRQMLRRDLERTGNAYVEVLRNPKGEVVFLRHIDAKMIRIVKLDDAVPVKKTIMRGKKEVTLTVMTRERRFCQLLNGVTLVYFKEFGASRDLSRKTGRWSPQGQKLPANDRATELLHFTALPDAHTPYGVPRWIMQLPSVLGSRKAEEFNMEFFDNGGVPPVLILLQGGVMAAETRRAMEQKTSGLARKNNRVQVIEVESSSGSLDNPGASKITVERFGADRQHDSMFEKYDERCELRVRRSFRLPPIFVGQAGDYSFATAFASYTVAEAQVFKPERDEFDEVISVKLLPAMNSAWRGYRMQSKPMHIEDATLRLQGLEVAQVIGVADPEDMIREVNATVGTHLKVNPKLVSNLLNPPLLSPTGSPGAPKGSKGANNGQGQTPVGLKTNAEEEGADHIEPKEPSPTPIARPPVVRKP